ncbi:MULTISPECIES: hypothetical protein [Bacillus]|uniref:Uncharacterized protein n=1 Tax=Bacillus cereus TaxID=1396 RepID=A0A164HQG8_BACCE|nr:MULTISPECIES: hypothetical protein [Bacillus]MCU0097656.1 hypothetical protein [Bacillus sp. OR9]HDR7437158.1 hypothetical protein [Bacillus anthracis]KZD40267.1 hypothetical protein B4082_0674 [Bacillus cereus]MBJ8062145.1 hypothetical protein [Bacillus cereus]MCU4760036.1 hypothetical protein [Bacillus cereus]
MLNNLLDEDELKIIECKFLKNERVRDLDFFQNKMYYVTANEDYVYLTNHGIGTLLVFAVLAFVMERIDKVFIILAKKTPSSRNGSE